MGHYRWVAATAIAPVAWGSTYFVTRELLPADHPIYGAAIRSVPAGLVLLAFARRLPRAAWWWRSAVIGTLNAGVFFVLVYLSAVLLPTSIASTVMATAPVMMMVFAWALLSDRPRVNQLAGAGLGIGGVVLMLFTGASGIDPLGVLVAVTAMMMSSLGFVLATRWARGGTGASVLQLTSWQLVGGGLALVPLAVVLEGAPPPIDGPTLLGFGYLTLVATALAFAVWFTGLRKLSAGTVGLIGLLNPVTGVLLGTIVAGEVLSARQMCGIALVIAGIVLGQRRASSAGRTCFTNAGGTLERRSSNQSIMNSGTCGVRPGVPQLMIDDPDDGPPLAAWTDHEVEHPIRRRSRTQVHDQLAT